MLNLKEIAERIAEPITCVASDTEDLKKLCETYPYSQVFPILYLNVLSKSKDVRFDDELQKYAYRISDRTMLYNLLNQTNFEVENNEETHEIQVIPGLEVIEQTETKVDTIIETKIEEVEVPIETEIESIVETKVDETPETVDVSNEIAQEIVENESIINIEEDELVDNQQIAGIDEEIEIPIDLNIIEELNVDSEEEIIEEIKVDTQKVDDPIVELEKIEEIIEPPVEEIELESVESNDSLNQALDEEVHFELDLSETVQDDIVEKTEITSKIEKEPLVVAGFESIPIDEVFQKLDEAQQERDIQFKDDLTAHTIASAYSIEEEEKRLAKLNELALEKPDPTEEEIITPIPTIIEGKRSFSSWLHSNENYSESKEEKIDVNTLISKFIEDSPKISPIDEKLFEGRTEKKEFYSPVKKAKESLDENNMPVSETLAKVFAAQGNYPKAIYAYEQLMLIIPEKKISFAVQIKELQKKLNK